MKRAYNFNAGPAALPEAVLQKANTEWLNFQNSGMSVLELSHRSRLYSDIHQQAQSLLRELLDIPDEYEVLFLQGGASLQFSMVPMNLLAEGKTASYVLTGVWSEKALAEAKKIGSVSVAASAKESGYRTIPASGQLAYSENCAYLHITSNNTIYGTQWHDFPKTSDIPLVADMSSDLLSKVIDVKQFGLIYAGAQKNLGPSGVTVVIIRKDLINSHLDNLPVMMQYSTHSKARSLYNTPPTFAIYMLLLVLQWTKEQGGIPAIQQKNEEKAKLIYDAIDGSDGFYQGHADAGYRSKMNITFTLPTQELTEQFLKQAEAAGFVGLAGHRSVGGCRASTYNAVPYEHCQELTRFMEQFHHSTAKLLLNEQAK
ncbi:3-phosphoserine/phosphohydroxythreonine transaminase [Bacillus testis]|uniref:3-phosphoserine/phosphohydroxythreonine transaminase n=1 Tax=Bacillus testis TaxID=1622072 RepID=UPI00067F05A2|nr:3-phosphoserine/phosphohydroxythreonine transaminase [Bacillus testis]